MNRFAFTTIPAKAWLFLVLLLYVSLWLMYPHEFFASDPGAYSARAYAISKSLNFGNGEIFDQRLGVTVPVAFIYSLLGVNILTANLWPLLAALLLIVTVWLALPDDRSRLIGAALCMTSFPLFDATTALYPDLIATAFMSASSLILFNRKKLISLQHAWSFAAIGAVACLFIAFLAKESAYWALPLWALALYADLKDDDSQILLRRFHIPALTAGLILGGIYLAFCDAVWGDPFSRLHSIQALTGQHLWSWEKTSTHRLVERLTTAPFKFLLDQYGAFTLVMAALGVLIAPRSIRPWFYYSASCVLLFWFGSTSFTRYEPIPLIDRMAFPLLPGFYVLAAFAISRLSLMTERPHLNAFVPILIVIGFAGVTFSQYVKAWGQAEVPEASAIEIVRTVVKKHPERNYFLVSSDSRSPDALSFYFGYQYPKNLRVAYVGDLKANALRNDVKFIYVNKVRSEFLKSAYGTRYYDDEIDALNLASIYKSGDVELFISINNDDLSKLIHSGDPARHAKN